MCAKKIPLVSMEAEQKVKRAQTRERGPPSALAEFEIKITGILVSRIMLYIDPLNI